MIKLTRFAGNPILSPDKSHAWETVAAFNGCVVKSDGERFHIFYRALSSPQKVAGTELKLSTIGHGEGNDPLHFTKREQIIIPEYEWEQFGCEDPRVTKIDDTYYIFYTALSSYPPTPDGIKIAVAVTRDPSKIEHKHEVTFFNSKAMALFPERINGKLAAILTVHTDIPPAKIALAFFDDIEKLWDRTFWEEWYYSLDEHIIGLLRSSADHIEVGALPIKTHDGWLLIYSYVRNYFSDQKNFGIEAVLLDSASPQKVIGRTSDPLLTPEEEYEQYGEVAHVIFPSGAIVNNNELGVYYGAADTTTCLATCSLDELIQELRHFEYIKPSTTSTHKLFEKFPENPLISPLPEHEWESRYTFNPAAVYEGGKVHIIYRAMGGDDTSVLGYASSQDGVHIDARLPKPIYMPREKFEVKLETGNSGCEDPRITRIEDRFFMLYTAYNGKDNTRVALTSIKVNDFLDHEWNWGKPVIISPPDLNDKNACILPEKINGKYVILHRIYHSIWIDFVDSLYFDQSKWVYGSILLQVRDGKWDSDKVGIGPPPIKTRAGWLLIYHGLSKEDRRYRLGLALLDGENPARVISRLDAPILEPTEEYEGSGARPGTVFACGGVVIEDRVFVYYGGADQFVCGASAKIDDLLALFGK